MSASWVACGELWPSIGLLSMVMLLISVVDGVD